MFPQLRKNLILLTLLITFVIGGLFVPATTHAAGPEATTQPTALQNAALGFANVIDSGHPDVVLTPIATMIRAGVAAKQMSDSGMGVFQALIEASKQQIIILGTQAISTASWLLALAGTVLDKVIDTTIYGMSNFVTTSAAIQEVWKTIRDLCNILFIFTLMYIAINTILQREGFYTRKLIAKVIIAALLINFSMFFTKMIIDVSNILTIKFYTAIKADGAHLSAQGSNEATTLTTSGLAPAYVQQMGLVKIYTSATDLSAFQVMGSVVLAFILILVASFAFFTVAILLIVRFISLILILIFSPIMFASTILPTTKGYADKWWGTLNSQCVFAPVFMMLAWISFKIIPQAGDSSSNQSMVESYVLSLGFLIASVTVAKSSSKIAANVINTSTGLIGTQIAGRAAKWAGGAYDKGAASMANSKVGSIINRVPLLNVGIAGIDKGIRKQLKTVEDAKFGGGKNLAAYIKEDKERGQFLNKTYADNMQAAEIKKTKEALENAIKLNPATNPDREQKIKENLYKLKDADLYDIGGKPEVLRYMRSDQYEAYLSDKNTELSVTARNAAKETRKKQLEEALDPTTGNPAEVQRIIKERSASEIADYKTSTLNDIALKGMMTKQIADAINKKSNLTEEQKSNIIYAKEQKAFDEATKAGATAAEKEAAEKAIVELSAKDFAALNSKYHENAFIMQKATVAQLNELMNSEKISLDRKKEIMKARFSDILNLTSGGSVAGHEKKIEGLTSDEIEHLLTHDNKLAGNKDFVGNIKSKNFEKINDSKNLTTSQKDTVKTTRLQPLKDAVADLSSTDVNVRNAAVKEIKNQLVNKLDTKAVANLDLITLTNKYVVGNINTQVLKQMKEDPAKAREFRKFITQDLTDAQRTIYKVDQIYKWLTENNSGKEFGV